MRYFITGATGFLGKRLVRKLLASGGNTVHFLLRAESRDKLPSLLEWWHDDGSRAIPVFGNVRQPRLSMAEADVAALRGKIDHFFHLAAIYDLKADAAAQVATNVEGTRNAVALANELEAGRFQHVSSIAAAGLYEGVFREDMFDEAEHLDHPYFSTKHESEKLVRQECRVHWRIYRPGLVVGDSHTGEMDKVDGPYYFFKLIQKMRGMLPAWMPAPGIEGGRINIVPVDFVVDAMNCIAHQPGLDYRCFHLTDPVPKRVGEVLDLFSHAAHGPEMSLRVNAALIGFVPEGVRKGVAALKPVQRLHDAAMRDLGLPDGIMQFVNYPTRFDNRQAAEVLNACGIRCPPLEQYADKLWDYWERHLDPALFVDRSLRGQVGGKVVVVTGGSSGIGLATARKLVRAGAVTVICGRDEAKLAAARKEINAAGFYVLTYPVNLADGVDCDRFAQTLLADFGHVDILINNAGRSIRRAIEASYDRFHDVERTMQLNYFGAVRLTMGLLPTMAARKSGQVINISSIGVLTNAPRFSAYVASKAALEAWTLCAASEYADLGVKFSIINMPLVRTPMIAPTRVYRDVPALTPEQAAEHVIEAIVDKPVRIATKVGIVGQGMHTLMPHAAQILLNTAFRTFPDSGEGGASQGEPIAATPEQLALQHLLRGVHL